MYDVSVQSMMEVFNKHDDGSPEWQCAAIALGTAFPTSRREALRQLVMEGPVYDGDVISKSERDTLMSWGLASRACVKGEQGYTVANYVGSRVLKALDL